MIGPETYFWIGFGALGLAIIIVLVIGIRMFRTLRSLEAIFTTSLMRWAAEGSVAVETNKWPEAAALPANRSWNLLNPAATANPEL